MKCCDLTPGKLRHRIELQQPVETPDGAGGVTVSWQTYARPVAQIVPLTGNERLAADRLENPLRKRIFLRFRADVQERHRVLYKGLAHHITYVIDVDEARRWLEVGVTQGVAT